MTRCAAQRSSRTTPWGSCAPLCATGASPSTSTSTLQAIGRLPRAFRRRPLRLRARYSRRAWGRNSLNVQVLAAGGAQIETRALGPGNRTLVLNRPTETIQYEFDASGFLQRKTVSVFGQATQVWRFTWSPSGQLSELAEPDGQVWKYEYDALGRRLKKSGPSGATTFVWEGRRLLHVLQDGQSPITLVNDPVAFEALMRKRGEDVHFVLPDHMGATSELVAPNGVLSWWRLQDSWGKPAAGGEGEPGFMGQWLDAESGLYYNDYRYYDPELGRYISPDPIGIVGGLNEYGYVACPFEGVDPHGLANALGGGPFDYNGSHDNTGAPDPRSTSGETPRQVSSRSSGTDPRRSIRDPDRTCSWY